MKPTWYMCYNPYPEGKKPIKRHETLAAVQAESARLSLLTKQKIHVLQLVCTAHPPTLEVK